MDIVINSEYEAASTKIFIEDLGPKLAQHHDVTYDDWNHYDEYDVALFMEAKHISQAKKQNPHIFTGVMDAKASPGAGESLAEADFLLVGSIEQKNYMLKYHDTVLIYRDFPEYDYGEPRIHQNSDHIRIGYHGNIQHLRHLYPTITGALEELGEEYSIELYAIYNYKKRGKWTSDIPDNIKIRHIQWSPDVYKNYLSNVDIGIKNDCMPCNNRLAELVMGQSPANVIWNINENYINSFIIRRLLEKQSIFRIIEFRHNDYVTRYKYPTNPGRLYPYAELEIPVVADFTPSNAELITHGESGYLASTKESWVHYISELIDDTERRQFFGKNLRETIRNKHSLESCFENLNEFLETQLKRDERQ